MAHDALTNGQADAGARYVSAMQTLEDSKDAFMIGGRNPDAVVFYREDPVVVAAIRPDINFFLALF
jgi:hypothetical protein